MFGKSTASLTGGSLPGRGGHDESDDATEILTLGSDSDEGCLDLDGWWIQRYRRGHART